jgi:hypothetical protein
MTAAASPAPPVMPAPAQTRVTVACPSRVRFTGPTQVTSTGPAEVASTGPTQMASARPAQVTAASPAPRSALGGSPSMAMALPVAYVMSPPTTVAAAVVVLVLARSASLALPAVVGLARLLGRSWQDGREQIGWRRHARLERGRQCRTRLGERRRRCGLLLDDRGGRRLGPGEWAAQRQWLLDDGDR